MISAMAHPPIPRHTARHVARGQRGVTTIEAMVALLVMSFGMVALVGLLGNLRLSGDVAKQRSEAMRIAQNELETLRSFTVLTKADGDSTTLDYDKTIVTPSDAISVPAENSNTTFLLSRQVTPLISDQPEPRARTVSVSVSWTDRSGSPQTVTLHTIISRTDPLLSAALGVTPPTNGIRTPDGRNPVIPVGAKDLGTGISAYRPSAGSTTVWVFNNVTGVITGVCAIDATQPVSALTASSVDGCKNNTVGYLVAGTVRFSATSPANPSAPEAVAQPLSVSVSLRASEFKDAKGDLLSGADYPITPPYQCFSDAPSSPTPQQTFVNYSCIVYPNTQSPRNWWGQVLLNGLDLGTTASKFRVCRYSADYNGNGYTYAPATDGSFKIDNEEHPEVYRGVSYSLARQNFLVVRGDVSCPTAPAPDPTHGIFVDYSTAQIQP
jgi:Tfp pilus assembly protein PilV